SRGRGPRVVAEMDSSRSGGAASTLATMAPLPPPEGPERTISFPRRPDCWYPPPWVNARCLLLLAAELGEQGVLLLGTQAADPAGGGDVELLHDLAGADLADPGHALEHAGDLHLAHRLVGIFGKDGGQAHVATLELSLELGSLAAGLGRLLQRLLALLGRQGWQGHSCLLVTSFWIEDSRILCIPWRRPQSIGAGQNPPLFTKRQIDHQCPGLWAGSRVRPGPRQGGRRRPGRALPWRPRPHRLTW